MTGAGALKLKRPGLVTTVRPAEYHPRARGNRQEMHRNPSAGTCPYYQDPSGCFPERGNGHNVRRGLARSSRPDGSLPVT